MAPCPSSAALEDFAARSHSAPELDAHLEQCARCRTTVNEIRGNNAFAAQFRQMAAATGRSGGETPPGYEVRSVIARGGQGVVYLAYHPATKRTVALKVLGSAALTLRERRRFEREVELVAALRHPHVVTVYDGGSTPDGRAFLAMEYVEGQTLDQWVAKGGATHGKVRKPSDNERRGAQEVLALFVKICDAVNHAHQHGIIHRDLKPANILVSHEATKPRSHEENAGSALPPSVAPWLRGSVASSPEPRILDFGLAKGIDSGPAGGDLTVSLAGAFQGTLAYAAPEQVAGDARQVDVRADVYALGMVLYHALTGEAPYPMDGSMADVLKHITDTNPIRPSAHEPALGDELDAIILKALSKEPKRRYQTAGELGKDLERYLHGGQVLAKADSRWYVVRKTARRHRAAILGILLILSLLAGFGVLMSIQAGRLADHRNRLQEALSASNIERARLIGRTGNMSAAEDLLWRELLHPGERETSGERDRPGLTSKPAYWGLRELYAGQPCLMTVASDIHEPLVGFDRTGENLWFLAPMTGTLLRRDAASGRLLDGVEKHTRPVPITGFWRGGEVLLTASSDGLVERWDLVDSRAPHPLLTVDGSRPVACALSTDGRRLAIGGADGAICMHDTETGELSASVPGHEASVLWLRFSPDGRWLTSAEHHGRIRLWNVESKEAIIPVTDVSDRIDPPVPPGIAFSTDSRTLVYRRIDSLRFWDILTREETRRIEGHGGNLADFAFTKDGKRIAVGGYNGVVKIYDLTTGAWTATYAGHTGGVIYLYYSPDERKLATCALDGTVRIWDTSTDWRPRAIDDHPDSVLAAEFSPDGAWLATAGGRDASVRVRRLTDTGPGRVLGMHERVASVVAFHPDGQRIASGGHDQRIKLWDLRGEVAPIEIIADHDRVASLAFSPNGEWLASGGEDYEVKLWKVEHGLTLAGRWPGHRARIPSVSFSSDGKQLASTSRDGTVRIWNVADGSPVRVLTGHQGPVRCARFSPDRLWIASAADDGSVRIWDSRTGECLRTLTGHSGEVYSLCFSPDGKWLASGDRGGQIRFWDPSSGRSLAGLPGPRIVFSLCVSAEGRWLAVGGDNPTSLHVWDLDSFDRHVAGNLEYRLGRSQGEPLDPSRVDSSRAWAAEVLARPTAASVSGE